MTKKLKVFFLLCLGITRITVSANPIPQEQMISRECILPNGIVTYFIEAPELTDTLSIRLKSISCDSLPISKVVGIDIPFDHEESLKDFLLLCKQDVKSFGEAPVFVVIGNFKREFIVDLINYYFSSFQTDKIENWVNHLQFIRSSEEKCKLNFDYISSSSLIEQIEDIQKEWIRILFQQLLQKRLHERIAKFSIDFKQSPDIRWTSNSSYGISIECKEKTFLDVFLNLLSEIEMIKNQGFSEEEFDEIKLYSLSNLHLLAQAQEEKNISLMADFYADQLQNYEGLLSADFFLSTSFAALEKISLSTLNKKIQNFLSEEKRFIQIIYPMNAAFPRGQLGIENFLQIAKNVKNRELGEWLPISLSNSTMHEHSLSNSPNAFFDLPLIDSEKKTISQIIKTMATKNIVMLAFEKKRLQKKGAKIRKVHPLRFLGYVLGDPYLKHCLQVIKKSSFKWDHLIDGLSGRLKEEESRDNLRPYIPGFSDYLGVESKEVYQFIEKREWEGLVRYLLVH